MCQISGQSGNLRFQNGGDGVAVPGRNLVVVEQGNVFGGSQRVRQMNGVRIKRARAPGGYDGYLMASQDFPDAFADKLAAFQRGFHQGGAHFTDAGMFVKGVSVRPFCNQDGLHPYFLQCIQVQQGIHQFLRVHQGLFHMYGKDFAPEVGNILQYGTDVG